MNLHASQSSDTIDLSWELTSINVVSWDFRDYNHHAPEGRFSQGRRCHCKSSLPRNPNVLKQIGDLNSDLDFHEFTAGVFSWSGHRVDLEYNNSIIRTNYIKEYML
jgi:hypothetical protein